MRGISKMAVARVAIVAAAMTASGGLYAQQQDTAAQQQPAVQAEANPSVIVNGRRAPAGPDIKGVIVARNGDKLKIAAADGSSTTVAVDDQTRIRAGGGLFGGRSKLAADSLLNGLPVTVKTQQLDGGDAGGGLVAREISFRKGDLRTASMIRNGTSQRFDEQTAATEALRGRMGDIDKYNIKSTTNVHFATGKADLSPSDKANLCATATQAQGQENALMLVVGYTDSTGGDDLNQQLSEKRAARVINYLQQACGWKPYRMLTPTGMAKADPLASNDTPDGKAQNRRVAVNILVSKSVDGF
ncbi:MAG: OmpA family protein [Sphingomonas sp.]|uniref:OmpA family protein n=1 Tax=Sphingomonas sp. TaxID=28214 RepID=UPI001AC847A2|nr:OmpA family protein [Sphingomonas sp.]MBN8809301.1 OmpA family protein [Sphingomonas sp.]